MRHNYFSIKPCSSLVKIMILNAPGPQRKEGCRVHDEMTNPKTPYQ